MLRLKLQYFGRLMWRADSTEKTLMLGKTEGRRRRGRQDEIVGWPHQLNGHEFERTLRDNKGQGSLACWVHGVKNSWTWLSNWKTTPCMRAKSLQSCLTLSDPMDCRLSGFFVQGVLQEGILEWVAIFLQAIFPTLGSNPCLLRFLHWQAVLYHKRHLGSPNTGYLQEWKVWDWTAEWSRL